METLIGASKITKSLLEFTSEFGLVLKDQDFQIGEFGLVPKDQDFYSEIERESHCLPDLEDKGVNITIKKSSNSNSVALQSTDIK